MGVLSAVYRFLDPNHDSEVSFKEFNVLAGIWSELQQSTYEFVEHLKDRFGSLLKAWDYADEDKSGEMDVHEFTTLARRWHFDGPVSQIFMYLDNDGSNSIGKDEWMKLENFAKPAPMLLKGPSGHLGTLTRGASNTSGCDEEVDEL